jgi:hypothetical protein
MKVKDIQNREDLFLITDDGDIAIIGKIIGKDLVGCYLCLYIQVIDLGIIGDVYGCLNNIPYLEEEIFKLN